MLEVINNLLKRFFYPLEVTTWGNYPKFAVVTPSPPWMTVTIIASTAVVTPSPMDDSHYNCQYRCKARRSCLPNEPKQWGSPRGLFSAQGKTYLLHPFEFLRIKYPLRLHHNQMYDCNEQTSAISWWIDYQGLNGHGSAEMHPEMFLSGFFFIVTTLQDTWAEGTWENSQFPQKII